MSSKIVLPGYKLLKNLSRSCSVSISTSTNITSKKFLSTISNSYSYSEQNETEKPSPLKGIRVLDLTRILAGPYCTMLLGDLGADIIKIEKPGIGDDTRYWGPPDINGLSCYFICVNRNKRSLALDLKKGNKILKELAKKSDILVENFIPGTLTKLGLGYEELKEINPRLIYCSISGFGQDLHEDYRDRGGYDVIVSALGGLMHITGPSNAEPCKVGVAITDLATGLYAHGSIMAALLQRQQTGRGQHIDCNLLSTQIAQLVNIGSNYLNANVEGRRWGSAHETIVPYQAFQTRDNRWLVIGAGNNDLFKELCQRINCDDLASDERYLTNALRVKNREQLLQVISTKIKEKTCDEWRIIFQGSKLPYSPINNMQEAFDDPQVKHNKMVRQLGPYKVVGPAVKFSDSMNEPRSLPPFLGQHSRQILSNELGLTDQEIDKLVAQSVIDE